MSHDDDTPKRSLGDRLKQRLSELTGELLDSVSELLSPPPQPVPVRVRVRRYPQRY